MSNFPEPARHLWQDYEQNKHLFEIQPAILQHFLESQARQIASALTAPVYHVQFSLPDRINTPNRQMGHETVISIPEGQREHSIGGPLQVLLRQPVREALLRRLLELEHSPDLAIATGASLLRFAAASHMVTNMLPEGRSVSYRPDDDEAIPSIPLDDNQLESAITQSADAIAEEGAVDAGRGELQSPFVPAARRFFLPQWVAFDAAGALIAGSEKEAEACVGSMQKYVQVLHRSSSLAPYMVACESYQRKRYGIMGQLINQGRALANYKTAQIISEIKERAASGTLNRGLALTMPYFDDQNLEMSQISFEVIPAGRIMFVPAFVVRASLGEQAKVSQDTRLDSSTRKHLLAQLKTIETAFLPASSER